MQFQEEMLLNVYDNLREEIIKRIEIENQLISFNLIVLGAVMSVGITTVNTFILLTYPVISMFLAVAWSDNQLRIAEISVYIREKIAPTLGKTIIGWEIAQERFYTYPYAIRHLILTFLGKRGIFLGTQIAVLALSFTKTNLNDRATIVYLSIDTIACIITALVLFISRRLKHMP